MDKTITGTTIFDPDRINDLILLKVFSYLPIKPLHKCMCVCRKWSSLAKEAISSRKSHAQTFFLDYDKWTDVNKTGKMIPTFVMSRSDFTTKTKSELDKLTSHPKIVILFHLLLENHLVKLSDTETVTETAGEPNGDEEPKVKRLKKSEFKSYNLVHIKEALYRHFSNDIKVFSVKCEGIIGTDIRLRNTIEVEGADDRVKLSGLSLPESDNFRFSLVPIDCSDKASDSKETVKFNDKLGTEEELYNWLGINKSTELLRSLFIFQAPIQARHLPPSRVRKFICNLDKIRKTIGLNNPNNFIVSGGVIQSLSSLNQQKYNNMTILYLTERVKEDEPVETVQIAQIVIPDLPLGLMSDIWREKVDTLQRNNPCFVSASSKDRQLFAIQITCIARGREYFGGEENYESKLFQKSFPNVPIVGFFGMGELGMDFFYMKDHEEFKFREYYFEKSKQFSYTSVFTIFSLKC
jgi:hypothetical protein